MSSQSCGFSYDHFTVNTCSDYNSIDTTSEDIISDGIGEIALNSTIYGENAGNVTDVTIETVNKKYGELSKLDVDFMFM